MTSPGLRGHSAPQSSHFSSFLIQQTINERATRDKLKETTEKTAEKKKD
jgi:hypothetical protein